MGAYTDDGFYEEWGKSIYENWCVGDFSIPHEISRQPGYDLICAIIHGVGVLLGGHHCLNIRIVNVAAGSVIPGLVYLIGKRVMDEELALSAGKLAVFFPEFLFYSGMELRDMFIVVCMVGAIWALAKGLQDKSSVGILSLTLCIVAMFYLRVGYALILLASIGTIIIQHLAFQAGSWYRRIINGGMVCAGLVLGGYLLAYGGRFQAANDLSIDEQIIAYKEHSMDVAGSDSFALKLNKKLPQVLKPVIMPLVMMIMPYPPWSFLRHFSLAQFIDLIRGLSWTICIPFYFVGLWNMVRGKILHQSLIWIPMLAVFYACSSGSFQQRYALPAYPFALLFVVQGFDALKAKFTWWFMMQGSLASVYLFGKLLF